MQVLIATDGELDVSQVAPLAARLAGNSGHVIVLTVVEIPRSLLADLRRVFGEPAATASIDPNLEYGKTTPRPAVGSGWPGDDVIIERYVADQLESRTKAVVAALKEHGVEADVVSRESENPVSEILAYVLNNGIDVLCIGSHGQGGFDGLLGSTSTKLVRRSSCPVLVARG